MKTFVHEPTRHKDLFRVVDREGDWGEYFFAPSGVYLRGVTAILATGYAKGEGFMQWAFNTTPDERDAILKEAQSRGDKVHRFIEHALTSEGDGEFKREEAIYSKETKDYEHVTNREWDCILSFGRFWTLHEPILLAAEATLYNLKLKYAGTTDAMLILTKACDVKACGCKDLIGKIGLWDWKSSKGIYPSHIAQAAAYAKTDNIGNYLPKKRKVEYLAILQVGSKHKTTGGYTFEVVVGKEEMNAAYARFLAAKTISDHEYRPFDPMKDIQEIPDEVKIVVKKYEEPKKLKAKKKKDAKS